MASNPWDANRYWKRNDQSSGRQGTAAGDDEIVLRRSFIEGNGIGQHRPVSDDHRTRATVETSRSFEAGSEYQRRNHGTQNRGSTRAHSSGRSSF